MLGQRRRLSGFVWSEPGRLRGSREGRRPQGCAQPYGSAKSLDPLYVDSTTADQICQNYGDTLVQENIDQSEYLPCIATKWEISEDGKTYTFTIRDDVYFQPGKFQDGRLLTSEDVAY